MKNNRLNWASLLLVLVMGLVSCCAPRRPEPPPETPAKGTPDVNQPPRTGAAPQVAALKANVSRVEAVIDSVIQGADPYAFTLRVTITKSTSVEPAENLAETGQSMTLVPMYVLAGEAVPDTSSPRNKGLQLLRSASKGDILKGRIALGSDGRWMLVEVESP